MKKTLLFASLLAVVFITAGCSQANETENTNSAPAAATEVEETTTAPTPTEAVETEETAVEEETVVEEEEEATIAEGMVEINVLSSCREHEETLVVDESDIQTASDGSLYIDLSDEGYSSYMMEVEDENYDNAYVPEGTDCISDEAAQEIEEFINEYNESLREVTILTECGEFVETTSLEPEKINAQDDGVEYFFYDGTTYFSYQHDGYDDPFAPDKKCTDKQ